MSIYVVRSGRLTSHGAFRSRKDAEAWVKRAIELKQYLLDSCEEWRDIVDSNGEEVYVYGEDLATSFDITEVEVMSFDSSSPRIRYD